ncbi:MAG: Coenzyme PQQ synthesis protein E [Anaerolineales bacterium]|nr:Coenzyme PQQ synthesis protein E [Anaerolineales bacterium]
MYSLTEISDDPTTFRDAVLHARAFRPLYAKIKVIYGCNLKCEMCNHWRESRGLALKTEKFKEIIRDLAELGCRKIHFTGGEPMLRGDIPELTAHAHALGIRVCMTSNGSLIDKAKAKALVEAGLRGINISIDSPIRKIHEKIRGVAGSWKLTTRAVGYFRKYARKGKISIRINTVVSRENFDTLETLPELAHELGADGINLIPVDDHCGEHLSLRKKDIAFFNEHIAPKIAARALELGLIVSEEDAFPFGQDEREVRLARAGRYALGYYKARPCYAAWTHTLIDHRGLVYVCCMTRDQIPPLGDLKQSTFKEVWEGRAYQRIRLNMHPPALPMCQRCDDFIEENKKIWETIGPY